MQVPIHPSERTGSAAALFRIIRFLWLLAADVIPVLCAALLPWSTSAFSIFLAVWLVLLVPIIVYRTFVRSLSQPSYFLPLTLFALAVAGLFWADGPWRDRFAGLSPVVKLLVMPFFMTYFASSKRSHWVLWSFGISCVLLLAGSWAVLLEPQWSFAKSDFAGVPVKNSIDQSYEFALCMVVLARMARALLERRRLAAFVACVSMMLIFFVNLTFVSTSRTALLYIPVLFVLFSIRYFNMKATAAFILVSVIAGMLVWNLSSYLRSRVLQIGVEYNQYRDENKANSTGERLTYWRESIQWIRMAPLIGHGTGSTKQLFEAAAAGKVSHWADKIRNPHNQLLYVMIQWGLFGGIILIAIWFFHARLFWGDARLSAWIGLVVVIQNILSSSLNSHIFDFTEGWIYVLGVATAAGLGKANDVSRRDDRQAIDNGPKQVLGLIARRC